MTIKETGATRPRMPAPDLLGLLMPLLPGGAVVGGKTVNIDPVIIWK